MAPSPPAFTPQLIRKTTVKILGVGGVDLKELENHALPVAIVNFLHGSGLVVSPDGVIVTARHVVKGLMGAPVVLPPWTTGLTLPTCFTKAKIVTWR